MVCAASVAVQPAMLSTSEARGDGGHLVWPGDRRVSRSNCLAGNRQQSPTVEGCWHHLKRALTRHGSGRRDKHASPEYASRANECRVRDYTQTNGRSDGNCECSECATGCAAATRARTTRSCRGRWCYDRRPAAAVTVAHTLLSAGRAGERACNALRACGVRFDDTRRDRGLRA